MRGPLGVTVATRPCPSPAARGRAVPHDRIARWPATRFTQGRRWSHLSGAATARRRARLLVSGAAAAVATAVLLALLSEPVLEDSGEAGEPHIDTCGCACLPSEARPVLSNRAGRTGFDPGNWPDEVGVAEDDRLSDTGRRVATRGRRRSPHGAVGSGSPFGAPAPRAATSSRSRLAGGIGRAPTGRRARRARTGLPERAAAPRRWRRRLGMRRQVGGVRRCWCSRTASAPPVRPRVTR
jgi:hypothetical protein